MAKELSDEELRRIQAKNRGKYIKGAYEELWKGVSEADRQREQHAAIRKGLHVLSAIEVAHLRSYLEERGVDDWKSEVQRTGAEYEEQLDELTRKYGGATSLYDRDMLRMYDYTEGWLHEAVETPGGVEKAIAEIKEIQVVPDEYKLDTLEDLVKDLLQTGQLLLDNLFNIFGEDRTYELLGRKLKKKYKFVLVGDEGRKVRIADAYWEAWDYSQYDIGVRLVVFGILTGDVKARQLQITAGASPNKVCVNYSGIAYKVEKEVCFDVDTFRKELLEELPVVKSSWEPLSDEFMPRAEDVAKGLVGGSDWLRQSEWVVPRVPREPVAVEEVTAILVTGRTYPNRRAIAAMGGIWRKELGGWVLPIEKKEEIEKLAEQKGLNTEEITGDRSILEPLTFVERRERREEKELTKAEQFRERAASREKEIEKLEAALKPYDDMAFWTEPIHPGDRGRKQRKLRESLRTKMDKIMELRKEAQELRDKADRMEGRVEKRAESTVYMDNRLKEAQANLRGVENDIAGKSSRSGYKPATGEWLERLNVQKADYERQVKYWEAKIEEAGGIQYSQENIKAGDKVKIRGQWCTVIRANPKTVTVDTPQGFVLKYNYSEIKELLHPPGVEEEAPLLPTAKIEPERIESFTGFRTEEAYGEGVRDLAGIVRHEIEELGNEDILDHLGLTKEDLPSFIEKLDKDGYYYAIWLCRTIENVVEYYCDPGRCLIEEYTVKYPFILSDLGEEGVLVGFREDALTKTGEHVGEKKVWDEETEKHYQAWVAKGNLQHPSISEEELDSAIHALVEESPDLLDLGWPAIRDRAAQAITVEPAGEIEKKGLTLYGVSKIPPSIVAMRFGDLPEESETEGVAAHRGVFFRRTKVTALDEKGVESTYSVQIDSKGNKTVRYLGKSERQVEEEKRKRWEEIPRDVRKIVDYYWPDLNLTQKQLMGAAIAGMDFDKTSLSVVLGGYTTKRKFLELFPHVTSFDGAVAALKELRSLTQEEAEKRTKQYQKLSPERVKEIEVLIDHRKGGREQADFYVKSRGKSTIEDLLDVEANELVQELQVLEYIAEPEAEPKITGTKYCEGCKHFQKTPTAQYCMLKPFEGQYTKTCPNMLLTDSKIVREKYLTLLGQYPDWIDIASLEGKLSDEKCDYGTMAAVREALVKEGVAELEETPSGWHIKLKGKKEVWEYTRAEYIEHRLAIDPEYQNALKATDKSNLPYVEDLVRKKAAREHEGAVTIRVAHNEPVPTNVLADYPDLKKKKPERSGAELGEEKPHPALAKIPEVIHFTDDITPVDIDRQWNDLLAIEEEIRRDNNPKIEKLKEEKKGKRGKEAKRLSEQIEFLEAQADTARAEAEGLFIAAQTELQERVLPKLEEAGITDEDRQQEALDIIASSLTERPYIERTWKMKISEIVDDAISVLGEEEEGVPPRSTLKGGLYSALHSFANCEERWEVRRLKGLTDEELKEAIAYEFGGGGGEAGPGVPSIAYKGGKHPAFYWGTPSAVGKPTLTGDKLISATRDLLKIPYPKPGMKYPPIPPEGITDEWIRDVLVVDSSVSLEVVRTTTGYTISFNKTIDGDVIPLHSVELRTIPSVEEFISRHRYEAEMVEDSAYTSEMTWKDEDVVWSKQTQRYREMFHKTYTEEQLEAMKVEELREIARAKDIPITIHRAKKNELVAWLLRVGKEATVKEWMFKAHGIKDYKGDRGDRIFVLKQLANYGQYGNISLRKDAFDMANALAKDLGYVHYTPEVKVSWERHFAQQIANETGTEVSIIEGSAVIKPEERISAPKEERKERELVFNANVLGAVATKKLLEGEVIQTIRSTKEAEQYAVGDRVIVILDGRTVGRAEILSKELSKLDKLDKSDANRGGFTSYKELKKALNRAGFRFKELSEYNAYRIQFKWLSPTVSDMQFIIEDATGFQEYILKSLKATDRATVVNALAKELSGRLAKKLRKTIEEGDAEQIADYIVGITMGGEVLFAPAVEEKAPPEKPPEKPPEVEEELNENEKKVLQAMINQEWEETKGDFGWTDLVEVEGITKNQIAGYMSDLQKKGFIEIFSHEPGIEGRQFQVLKKIFEPEEKVPVKKPIPVPVKPSIPEEVKPPEKPPEKPPVKKVKEVGKPEMPSLKDVLKFPSVTIIGGKRRSGKSATGYYIVEIAPHTKKFVIGLPEAAWNLLPSSITPLPLTEEVLESLPTDSVFLIDEASLAFYAKEHRTSMSKLMDELMLKSAQRGQTLVFISHNLRKLYVGIVLDADILIFKEPTIMQVKYERTELRPILHDVKRAFDAIAPEFAPELKLEYAYVVSDKYTGMVETPLPSFWNEELSLVWRKYGIKAELEEAVYEKTIYKRLEEEEIEEAPPEVVERYAPPVRKVIVPGPIEEYGYPVAEVWDTGGNEERAAWLIHAGVEDPEVVLEFYRLNWDYIPDNLKRKLMGIE